MRLTTCVVLKKVDQIVLKRKDKMSSNKRNGKGMTKMCLKCAGWCGYSGGEKREENEIWWNGKNILPLQTI